MHISLSQRKYCTNTVLMLIIKAYYIKVNITQHAPPIPNASVLLRAYLFSKRAHLIWQISITGLLAPRAIIEQAWDFAHLAEATKKVDQSLLFSWYTRRDSNSRPLVPKTSALIHWATGAPFVIITLFLRGRPFDFKHRHFSPFWYIIILYVSRWFFAVVVLSWLGAFLKDVAR